MFLWRAVRFVRSPAIPDVEATVHTWRREYTEYAECQRVEIVCAPEISEWLSLVRSIRAKRLGRRQLPCIGLSLDGVPRSRNKRWPLSSIDLWYSQVPRLEWEFQEDRRQVFLKQFVRTLLRRESIHLLVYDPIGVYLGWDYAVYVWLAFKRARSLDRKLDADLDEQSRRVSTFLARARSVAEDRGQPHRIAVRSRRERRQLEDFFEHHGVTWDG